jgi:hypothetical protein
MRAGYVAAAVLGAWALVAPVACGGSTSNASAGDAAAAVAEYWKQEQAGGLLPEGTQVLQSGATNPVKLKAQSGEKARYCIVFSYLEQKDTQAAHHRVYVAYLEGDVWTVDAVNPDGTCDGVG